MSWTTCRTSTPRRPWTRERVRILGIDPGLRSTGFGVIEQTGGKLRYITSGCVRSGEGELAVRLKVILDGMAEVIEANHPQEVAIEKVFVSVNPQSTLLLGQARGTAICAAVIAGLPVAEYTALQVKQAVVGNGHASVCASPWGWPRFFGRRGIALRMVMWPA